MINPYRTKLPDGSEKQINPFTGATVWYVPGRRNRPILTNPKNSPQKLNKSSPEDYCNFCPAFYFNTTPEKARVVVDGKNFVFQKHLSPDDIFSSTALMRRISNLYELRSLNYWEKNHGYKIPTQNKMWMESYLDSTTGRDHVKHVLEMKLGEPVGDNWERLATPFFASSHELIIPQKHYKENAEYTNEFMFAGELTPEEHFHYFEFTVKTIWDIYDTNPHVKYVSVYQNWLKEAGASFEHLHRQIMGIDEWGEITQTKTEMVSRNPNLFNEIALNLAVAENRLICENENAIAFSEFGYPFPTIAVYSKTNSGNPVEHTSEQIKGMSDLVHAIHAASGPHIPSNEEWHYTPKESPVKIPWHVLIKWRINVVAGFEGGTGIYVNPISLEDLRDELITGLLLLRSEGKVGKVLIGTECIVSENSE